MFRVFPLPNIVAINGRKGGTGLIACQGSRCAHIGAIAGRHSGCHRNWRRGGVDAGGRAVIDILLIAYAGIHHIGHGPGRIPKVRQLKPTTRRRTALEGIKVLRISRRGGSVIDGRRLWKDIDTGNKACRG